MGDAIARVGYLRAVDEARRAECRSDGVRFSQELTGPGREGHGCTISYIAVPVGSGSPAGLHTHEVDQMFFMLSGLLKIEIHGEVHELSSGGFVRFPAGVPHRNWNDGEEEAVYLAVNAPRSQDG